MYVILLIFLIFSQSDTRRRLSVLHTIVDDISRAGMLFAALFIDLSTNELTNDAEPKGQN